MTISAKQRKEITEWATQKALEEAPNDHSRLKQLNYDAWLQAQIWHYEKMAYLKIHNREARKR